MDANFLLLLNDLLRSSAGGDAIAAIGTHDPAIISYAEERIREYGLNRKQFTNFR